MTISVDFKNFVLESQLSIVRVILKDSLIIDPTFVEFEEMYKYAKSNMDNLLEEFNQERLDYDKNNWTEDYMNNLKVELMNNFSEERLEHLKQICSYLYQDKGEVGKQSEGNYSSVQNKPYEANRSYQTNQKIGPRGNIKVTFKESKKINPLPQIFIVLGLVTVIMGIILSKIPIVILGIIIIALGLLLKENN